MSASDTLTPQEQEIAMLAAAGLTNKQIGEQLYLSHRTWGLAILVGLSVLVAALIGRPEDEITAGITTTVVLVVAKLSPQEAWRQPILRLADTAIGVAVGLVAAWLGLRAIRPRIRPPESPSPNR